VPGTWSQIELEGHLCDLFEPARRAPHPLAVIYLHGVHLQRLVGNRAFEQQFDRHGLRVIAPMTQRSWWSNRICPEFDSKLTAERYVLDHVVPYLATQWQVTPPGIALLGTSMGGQGALRFAFKHPNMFPVVAALSPAIDYQWRMREGDETLSQMYRDEEEARQDTATLHVHPLNWPRNTFFACDPIDLRWHESAEKLRMKLYSLGIPHVCDLETSGGGHGFEYYNNMAPAAVDFIAERLNQEQARVV
jgi:S-formylglutathione hydrolase FrmB